MEKKPKLCGHVLERTPMARGVVYGWVGKDVEVAHGEGGEGELDGVGKGHALTPFIIASFASFIIPFIANCLVGSFLDA